MNTWRSLNWRKDVRIATPGDLIVAADVLAVAFHDYPWTRHVIPEEGYGERLREIQHLYLSHALDQGFVAVAGDIDGVIALLPPHPGAPVDDLIGRIVELHGDRIDRLGQGSPEHHDDESWTLETLGVGPDSQGRGIGGALITFALREAAGRGARAVRLETSDERNVRLYERHGFLVTGVNEVPDAPPVWSMQHRW